MNRQHLLSRLATDHAVVYSNGAWPSWDRRTAAFAQSPLLGRFDRCDGVTVDQRARLLVRVPRFPHLDELAIRVACVRWRERMSQDRGPLIAYIFHPEFLPFVKELRRTTSSITLMTYSVSWARIQQGSNETKINCLNLRIS